MQTRYSYRINFWSNELIKINFDGFKDDLYNTDQHGKSTPAVLAMEAALIKDLKLKSNEDYELVKSGFCHDQLATIHIHRPANIFIALNHLITNNFNKTGSFDLIPSPTQSISSKNPMQTCQEEISFKFMNTMAYCVDNNNLSLSDAEKIYPLLLASLNALNDELLQCELVKKLREKAVTTNDLLRHPFFQTLSMLMDDYTKRNTAHNNRGFLNKMGNKGINEEPYNEIYNKYKYFVPNCYCDHVEKPEHKTLDANKLKMSRNQESSATLTMGKRVNF